MALPGPSGGGGGVLRNRTTPSVATLAQCLIMSSGKKVIAFRFPFLSDLQRGFIGAAACAVNKRAQTRRPLDNCKITAGYCSSKNVKSQIDALVCFDFFV